MPCLRCGVEYGLFKKESFCRSCGFSYCSGCLTKKIVVPKLGAEGKHTVCHRCYGQLSSGKTEPTESKARPPSPPVALQKRMDHLNSSVASGFGMNGPSHVLNSKSTNPKNGDSVLASRLESLRADRMLGSIPSLSQLEERLAKLKGVQAALPSSDGGGGGGSGGLPNSRPPIDASQKRTFSEQTEQLFQEATEEVALDTTIGDRLNPDEEIRKRLERLRNSDDSLNDLNKKPAVDINGLAVSEFKNSVRDAGSSAPHSTFPISSVMNEDPSVTDDAHVLEVWQCILEAEREACREAEEALRLQEKDRELKVKLDEIRANRDTSVDGKRLSTAASKLHAATADCYSDEDNEDKLADKVLQQFLNEARLEADTEIASLAALRPSGRRRAERKLINSSEQDSDESEELPWCTICNNDASLRCYGCEGDLYCRRCFKECHDTQDLKEHPCGVYKPNERNGNR